MSVEYVTENRKFIVALNIMVLVVSSNDEQ